MTRLLLHSVALLTLILLLSFSGNPPQGRTGGPGERTCAASGCHSSFTPAFDGHIQLRGIESPIQKGITYDLILEFIVDRGTPARGGFQLMALTKEGVDVNAFADSGESSTISSANDRTYFEHDPAKQFDGQDTLTYQVKWRLDQEIESDEVIFYGAAIFANGNGGSSGDKIALLSDTIVVDSDPLIISTTVIHPSCSNTQDGQITLNVSGGAPTYQYSWSNGATDSPQQDSLGEGTYNVTICDSDSLKGFASISLFADADTIAPSLVCVQDTFTISSCAPFSYPSPIPMDECSESSVILISGLGPNRSFPPGVTIDVYEATDEAGNTARCTIVIDNIVAIHPDIRVTDIACVDDSTGSAVIDVTGSNPPFTITPVAGVDLSQLSEGIHEVIIMDNSGCSILEEIVINRPDSLSLDIVAIVQPLNSNDGDGIIDIMVSGGTPPYSYLWRTEDEDFSIEEDLRLLFPGAYQVEVTDDRGCKISSDTIIIEAITSTVDPIISQAINIYPNPVADYLQVDIAGQYRPRQVSIVDVGGRLIRDIMPFSDVLEVGDLRRGLYIMIIEVENQRKGMITFYKY